MTSGYVCPSPLGDIALGAEQGAISGLFFVGQKYFPSLDLVPATDSAEPAVRRAAAQIAEYFAGDRRAFDLPLNPRGTNFQRRVWRQLRAIAYGQTLSYRDLALRLGLKSGAARAVGHANSKNPISIIVPCHRVIAANGQLTGYAGGIERKHALLKLEQENLPTPLEPTSAVLNHGKLRLTDEPV